MSLIKLIRRYILYAVAFVFVIGCISHFFIFNLFIHYSSDSMLEDQKKSIEKYIAANDMLPLASTLILKPARIEERVYQPDSNELEEGFRDTVLFNSETRTFAPYRQLRFLITYQDQQHLITLNQPTIISNDLFYAIISSLLILLILLIVLTYVIEHLLKKEIWKPMKLNIEELHKYDLKGDSKLTLKDSGIHEFDEIYAMIIRMVDKINQDYNNSRFFIEDASHEMQTPLSIIKSKTDLLLQDESILQSDNNKKSIQAITRSVSRLSKLNKSLLLITKINNNQFEEKTDIQLDTQLSLHLEDLEELFEVKELTLKKEIQPCRLHIDPNLVEILLSNLLSNTIRHNIQGGEIDVFLDQKKLRIRNSCVPPQDDSADLFNRMAFHQKAKDSTGLGLNIVKSIADKNGFAIEYSYHNFESFCIQIHFQ